MSLVHKLRTINNVEYYTSFRHQEMQTMNTYNIYKKNSIRIIIQTWPEQQSQTNHFSHIHILSSFTYNKYYHHDLLCTNDFCTPPIIETISTADKGTWVNSLKSLCSESRHPAMVPLLLVPWGAPSLAMKSCFFANVVGQFHTQMTLDIIFQMYPFNEAENEFCPSIYPLNLSCAPDQGCIMFLNLKLIFLF